MSAEEDVFHGWHWLSHDRKLRYGDGREVVDGEPLSSEHPPEPYRSGMHASATIVQALNFAGMIEWSPDGYAWLCKVELKGEIVHAGDKSCARTRTAVVSKRVRVSVAVEFARWCSDRVAANAARAARAAADAAYAAERQSQEDWWQQKWESL